MHVTTNKNNFYFIFEMEYWKNQLPLSKEALLFSIINFASSHWFLTCIFYVF
jgi:hypothetical protein